MPGGKQNIASRGIEPRQDHAGSFDHRAGTARRRNLCIYRRRACTGHCLRVQPGCPDQGLDGLLTGQRGTGAGDRRYSGSLRVGGPHRG